MKHSLTILFTVILMTSLQAQVLDTLYYKNPQTISSKKNYDYYRMVTKIDKFSYDVKEYNKDNSLKATFSYKTESELEITTDNFQKMIKSKKLLLNGDYLTYNYDSLLTGEARYEFGKSIFGPVLYEDGDTLFLKADEMPKYQDKELESFQFFISSSLIYPKDAATMGRHGRVYVQFKIDKKGEVKDIKVTKSVYPLLDQEAVRVIKTSPRWTPGKNDGKPVDVVLTFPVNFELLDRTGLN